MNFWPLTDPLQTLPIGGKSIEEWLTLGVISQESIDSIQYPWQFLDLHQTILSTISGELQTTAQLAEGAQLFAGQDTQILPGVYVEGLVVIGENCKIGPNCYLRGPISIGNECHIGQAVELKNTIVGNQSNVGHLSYIGDSILGNEVNLGAGTITSNLRHDGKSHHSQVDGKLVNTERRKFGTIIGDRVHTGIHTSLYPGRKLGADTTTLPGEIVSKDKK